MMMCWCMVFWGPSTALLLPPSLSAPATRTLALRQLPPLAAVTCAALCTPTMAAITTASASPEELLEFLIDSARYGDAEDVAAALAEHRVQLDGMDSAGRTGACAVGCRSAVTRTALSFGVRGDVNSDRHHQLCLPAALARRSAAHGERQRAPRHRAPAAGGGRGA